MKRPREFSFDPTKEARNLLLRGISFEQARSFDFETSIVATDDRADYGEVRQVAAGFIGHRLHVLVFTMRDEICRVISLRKANKREIRAYVTKTTGLE